MWCMFSKDWLIGIIPRRFKLWTRHLLSLDEGSSDPSSAGTPRQRDATTVGYAGAMSGIRGSSLQPAESEMIPA
jgi:hypothetical protein